MVRLKLNTLLLALILLLFSSMHSAQPHNYKNLGSLYRFELSNSPFPHIERDSGFVYGGELYSKNEHYHDSTTLVFIPEYLKDDIQVDIVVYFHGWYNNVDTVLSQFHLIEQFYLSSRQGILVMPEGPKNAPDSFGGRLEEKDRFHLFIDEVITQVGKEHDSKLEFDNICLAGHSGAFRVISYILMRGGLTEKISEVFLFDGLYAGVEKYSHWLDHSEGIFINIYTPDGGTKRESENLMESLEGWGIPFTFIDGDDFSAENLNQNRIVFIASSLSHNEVVSSQNQFAKFLAREKKE